MIFIAPRVVHACAPGGGLLLVMGAAADMQAAAYSSSTRGAERHRV